MVSFDENTIKNIFCEVLGISSTDVTDTLAYNSCIQWDSLKHLQMVAMLEETFKIEIVDWCTLATNHSQHLR